MRAFTLLLLLLMAGRAAAEVPSQTAASAVAAPAFVDVVSFEYRLEGENHKLVVTTSANLLRADEVDDGFSVIYDASEDFYIGLENRNYTYWEFSWPQVRAAVEKSKRYESRLQELGSDGLNGDLPSPSTNSADASASSAGTDDSGYVWHPTTERRRIADLDCIRWTGDSVSGEKVEAWCYGGPIPQVRAAMQGLRAINGPIALVPVRTIAPDFIFPVYEALTKGGVTPVLIMWGQDQNQNSFRFIKAERRDGRMSLFTVPKLYIKTTLITMDGMIHPKK